MPHSSRQRTERTRNPPPQVTEHWIETCIYVGSDSRHGMVVVVCSRAVYMQADSLPMYVYTCNC